MLNKTNLFVRGLQKVNKNLKKKGKIWKKLKERNQKKVKLNTQI